MPPDPKFQCHFTEDSLTIVAPMDVVIYVLHKIPENWASRPGEGVKNHSSSPILLDHLFTQGYVLFSVLLIILANIS